MKTVDYSVLCAEAESLISGVGHPIANLSNLSALIFQTLSDLNWAGFYLAEGETLVLGPFQGRVACIEIPFGRGVCGTAAKEDKTQLVPDVHAFPGHIACDGASNSEIVIPLHRAGEVVGVLDIDSPVLNRFSEADREGLEALSAVIEKHVFG
ncbi:MAG: GAF domain-containing protein [Oscillospiraceae bacterium]|nr:GAF domain-containing protein [Oscillospiraceae bacterium]